MHQKQIHNWSRLDNVAKIFPNKMNRKETSVFRFSAEMFEIIDPEILQNALNTTIKEFPNFLYVMKKGVFWYYLEQSNLHPMVSPEKKVVCAPIYNGYMQHKLLFNITYYKKRINIEVYHVLADGTGALQFFRTLLYNYLCIKHKEELIFPISPLDIDSSLSQKSSDSFKKYYEKQKKFKKVSIKKAFNLKFKQREEENTQIIEGIVSVKKTLEVAHKYNTTMTVFLTAVLIDSIHKEMTLLNERHPIVLMVPVNLRQFFPSETTRNFFGLISIRYDFKKNSGDFEDILKSVDKTFKHELTRERLSKRMNALAALEYNPLVRVAPLPLKYIILRYAKQFNSRGQTAVLSNVGRISMPKELTKYIKLFNVFMSTIKLQLTLCSFEDNLQLGFTSGLISTDIQKNFFRTLTKNGIDVEIRCNDYYAKSEV